MASTTHCRLECRMRHYRLRMYAAEFEFSRDWAQTLQLMESIKQQTRDQKCDEIVFAYFSQQSVIYRASPKFTSGLTM